MKEMKLLTNLKIYILWVSAVTNFFSIFFIGSSWLLHLMYNSSEYKMSESHRLKEYLTNHLKYVFCGIKHHLTLFYQNAVSMYCRLGFAVKKGQVFSSDQLHPTWKNAPSVNRLKYVHPSITSTEQTKSRARWWYLDFDGTMVVPQLELSSFSSMKFRRLVEF